MKKLFISLILISISFFLHAQVFTEQTGIIISSGTVPSISWGDLDLDGDLDVLFTGKQSGLPSTSIYKNNGNNTFTAITGLSIISVNNGSTAFGDYDNDGDLDILITGISSSGNIAKVYKNNGNFSFIEQTGIILQPVHNGKTEWGDFDNDGDLDILISGKTQSNFGALKLYENKGNNLFVNAQMNIPYISADANAKSGDYDNDGDLDLLFLNSGQLKLYKNNNNFNFSEQPYITFSTSAIQTAVWGDYDDDGDLDITTIQNSYGGQKALVSYKNNGNNTFSQLSLISSSQNAPANICNGDYDNDGDLDIIHFEGPWTYIYINNNFSFSRLKITSITGISNCVHECGDYDNDGDLDLLIAGNPTKLFRNDIIQSNTPPSVPVNVNTVINGSDIIIKYNQSTDSNTVSKGLCYNYRIGTNSNPVKYFSPHSNVNSGLRHIVVKSRYNDTTIALNCFNFEIEDTLLMAVQAIDNCFQGSSFSIEDTLIMPLIVDYGYDTIINEGVSFQRNLFTNYQGLMDSLSFQWTPTAGLSNDTISNPIFSPLTDTKYVVTVNSPEGWVAQDTLSIKVLNHYFNVQTGILLTGVYRGRASWVDYNSDGNLDIFFSGRYDFSNSTVKIYKNNNNNIFAEQTGISFNSTSPTYHNCGDYDNDGDIDILITGGYNNNKLFNNIGDSSFSSVSVPNNSTYSDFFDCGDYDNDGDLDCITLGMLSSTPHYGTTSLYKNDSSHTFVTQTTPVFWGVYDGTAKWGDYDNDGDLDIFISGNHGSSASMPYEPYVKLYKNNGNNNFSVVNGLAFMDVEASSAAWGDYDNDGDLDIIVIGEKKLYQGNNNTYGVTILYRNDGNDNFYKLSINDFVGVYDGSVDWGDYDNDGDLDLIITGRSLQFSATKIYRNEGNDCFIDQLDTMLSNVSYGGGYWGDYDNDGDLDILLNGWDYDSSQVITKVYKNNITSPNTPPSTPTNLYSTITSTHIVLSWSPSTDNNTPSKALTYNLKVGTTPNGQDITSSQSMITTGKRKLVEMGNAQLDTTYLLDINNFNIGDIIYWSVQAIDNGFMESNFSTEFITTVCQAFLSDTSIIICKGKSILWRGNYYNATGNYFDSSYVFI